MASRRCSSAWLRAVSIPIRLRRAEYAFAALYSPIWVTPSLSTRTGSSLPMSKSGLIAGINESISTAGLAALRYHPIYQTPVSSFSSRDWRVIHSLLPHSSSLFPLPYLKPLNWAILHARAFLMRVKIDLGEMREETALHTAHE